MNVIKNLTLGIEEEYQIIDPKTRELTSFISEFLEKGAVIFKDQVKPELLQSQIEIGSNVCKDINQLEDDLKSIRYSLGKFVQENGKKIAAAGTHPFSSCLGNHQQCGRIHRCYLFWVFNRYLRGIWLYLWNSHWLPIK